MKVRAADGAVPAADENGRLRHALTKCALAIAYSYGGCPLTDDMPSEDRAMVEAMRAAYEALRTPPTEAAESPSAGVSFRVDSVEELIGQLVRAASSTRLWDELPIGYPRGAGTFVETAAGELVDAAMTEYRRLTERDRAAAAATSDQLQAQIAERDALVDQLQAQIAERDALVDQQDVENTKLRNRLQDVEAEHGQSAAEWRDRS